MNIQLNHGLNEVIKTNRPKMILMVGLPCSGKSTISKELAKGSTELLVLSVISKEDMYGYQLVQETERASGGKLTTQEGSLYPVLYRLLDQGLISDHRVQVGKRMTRIYYHIEPAGEDKLKELIQDYEDVTQGVFRIIHGEGKQNDRS